MSIKPLEIADIESKAGNIYEAVVIAAKRARQINDEEKLEYNQRIQPIVEQEVEDETVVSKDKQNVSLDFEMRKKHTERGLEELMASSLEFRLRTDEVEEEKE